MVQTRRHNEGVGHTRGPETKSIDKGPINDARWRDAEPLNDSREWSYSAEVQGLELASLMAALENEKSERALAETRLAQEMDRADRWEASAIGLYRSLPDDVAMACDCITFAETTEELINTARKCDEFARVALANAEVVCGLEVSARTRAEIVGDLVKTLDVFLGGDDRFQIAVGGNPIAIEKMLSDARAAVAKAKLSKTPSADGKSALSTSSLNKSDQP